MVSLKTYKKPKKAMPVLVTAGHHFFLKLCAL